MNSLIAVTLVIAAIFVTGMFIVMAACIEKLTIMTDKLEKLSKAVEDVSESIYDLENATFDVVIKRESEE